MGPALARIHGLLHHTMTEVSMYTLGGVKALAFTLYA